MIHDSPRWKRPVCIDRRWTSKTDIQTRAHSTQPEKQVAFWHALQYDGLEDAAQGRRPVTKDKSCATHSCEVPRVVRLIETK